MTDNNRRLFHTVGNIAFDLKFSSFSCSRRPLNNWLSNILVFDRTWWRLLRTRILWTIFHIYDFIVMYLTNTLSWLDSFDFDFWYLTPLSAIFQLYHIVTSFSCGRSRSTRKEPSTMGKELVNLITWGCESSAPFL